MLRALNHGLARFRRNQEGSLSVEAVLIFPLLMWCYLATFVYFDAFRNQSVNLKAAYTISDALSRETGYVTPTYLNSLWRLHRFLTTSNYVTRMRVTAVRYEEATDSYDVRWSREKGGWATLDTATLRASYLDILPRVANWKYIILVETQVAYEPMFSIGLAGFTFDNTITTVPRFASKVCWNDTPSDADTEVC